MSHTLLENLRALWYATVHNTRKNSHLMFFLRGFARYITPGSITQHQLKHLLAQFESLPEDEKAYIRQRVDYYCKFRDDITLPPDAPRLERFTYGERESYVHDYVNSTYFFDAQEFTRYYPSHFRWAYNPGDISYLFPVPEITKSRPVTPGDGNRNNILLNLDKVRHFIWVKDPFKWEEKECRIIFRGDVRNKPRRIKFLDMWQQHPLCDIQAGGHMRLYDHLYYKYIMALEGNDVASNLKWVMSSNSVAVMPRPTCETWFMEGQLIPNYHYIEIAADYHDLIERIMYYEEHPDEAKAIVEHAHEWVRQFRNPKRERLISLMVLDKYFALTGQKSAPSRKEKHYIVNDLVKLNAIQMVNAQGKAREDVVRTLESEGYTRYDITNWRYSWGTYKAYHHYPVITKRIARKQATRFIECVNEGDTVFIQDFHLPHMQYIATECRARKANVVFLIHDVQCIRFNIITDEIEKLNNASLLLVHTNAMADKLRSIGVTTAMRVITVFDYYADDAMQDAKTALEHKNEVIFAGNLTKSVFLKPLIEHNNYNAIQIRLYGILGDLDLSKSPNISYCGVFQPSKTGGIMGGWGLIWDGDSTDTCAGPMGDYLRYNASHKASLYLACGIPIIVWEHSSLAEWVKKENIGITVPDLHDLCRHINAVSDGAYRLMIANAQTVGQRLRQGKYLKEALKDV